MPIWTYDWYIGGSQSTGHSGANVHRFLYLISRKKIKRFFWFLKLLYIHIIQIMGTGASVESARSTMTSILMGKPLDASDIDVNSI